jgi:hypothetical protein
MGLVFRILRLIGIVRGEKGENGGKRGQMCVFRGRKVGEGGVGFREI